MFGASNRNEHGRHSVHNIGWYKLVKNENGNRNRNVEREDFNESSHTVDSMKMQSGTDLALAINKS